MFRMNKNRTSALTPALSRGERRAHWVTAAHRRRSRGSLLILAVVVLVVIALTGMAMLQQAKMDRVSMDRFERDYTELVINGVIGDLRVKLADDYTQNWNSRYGLYDYPWTDHTGTHPDHADDRHLATTFPVITGTGTNPNQLTWGHLTNLSTPGDNGKWLLLPTTDPASAATDPREFPIDSANPNIDESDTNLRLDFLLDRPSTGYTLGGPADYEVRGADADGDGVLDSRWQWVPDEVRSFGGLQFVMAARVIDASSLINVNTATPNAEAGNTRFNISTDENWPRGYYPSDVDLGRLFGRAERASSFGWAADWTDEADRLMYYRLLGSWMDPAPSISDPGWSGPAPTQISANLWSTGYPPALREVIWTRQGAMYGSRYGRYLADTDEMELRFRGGLNDSSNTTDIEGGGKGAKSYAATGGWGDGLPGLTRNINGGAFRPPLTQESAWSAVDNDGDGTPDVANMGQWFQGGPSTDPVKDRAFPAIRHMLTTVSGTAVFSPTYGSSPTTTNGTRLKHDLNSGVPSTHPSNNYDEIRERLEQVLMYGHSLTSVPPLYLGLSATELQERLIPDYALSILDYGDANEPVRVSSVEVNGTRRYAMDRLPFLREVYAQMLYEAQDLDPAGAPDGIPDIWVALPDTRAIAIEVGNPFIGEIKSTSLDGIWRFNVNGVEYIWDHSDPGSTDIGGYDGDNTTNTDTLVFVSEPADGSADTDGDGAPFDGLIDAGGGKKWVLPAAKRIDFPSGADLTVELEVEYVDATNGSTGRVVYDRMDTSLRFAATYPITDPTGINLGDQRFRQQDERRDAEDRAYVVNSTIPQSFGPDDPAPKDLDYKDDSDGAFKFGQDDKFGSPGVASWPAGFDSAAFMAMQFAHRSRPAGERNYFSVTELGLVPMVGFTAGQTWGEALIATPVDQWLLDIDPSTPSTVAGGPATGTSGLPHAAMLFDQFTTLSPRYNEADEDNYDGDENPSTNPNADRLREQLVPGTINVNTAPLHLMTLGAPLPETLDDTQALMETIVDYRDNPNSTTGPRASTLLNGRQGIPGIASLGELLFLNPSGNNEDMQWFRAAGALPADQFNLIPKPEDVSTDPYTPLTNTPEQELALARFQFLSQTFTTRSDVYVAYVKLRGYEEGAFNKGPRVEADFIVVLDRSGATQVGSGTPTEIPTRVLAYKRLR